MNEFIKIKTRGGSYFVNQIRKFDNFFQLILVGKQGAEKNLGTTDGRVLWETEVIIEVFRLS